MEILNLKLRNYRNYDSLNIEFNHGQNIIIGNNAQGKTNILEAIYYLAITKSFLINNEKSLIKNGFDYFNISGDIYTNKKNNLLITYKDGVKKLEINKKEIIKHSDYIGNMKVIIFNPDIVRIFKEGPVNRRKYLNIELSQLYGKYVNILNEYNYLLKQRNEYLKLIKINNKCNEIYLSIINDKFVSLNVSIIKYRNDYINAINKYIGDIFYNISGIKDLKIIYHPTVDIEDELLMRQNLLNKIRNSYDRELTYGSSLIGVHREDFGLYMGDLDLSIYGSQGQIKLAILALKLSEVFVFNDVCGEYPILLLDDIFSELDLEKRNNVIKYLNMDVQSIITTTDLNNINKDFIDKACIYKVENGSVTTEFNTGSEE